MTVCETWQHSHKDTLSEFFCHVFQVWQHCECVGWNPAHDADLEHVCRQCEAIIDVPATLVVCPSAIAEQWQHEAVDAPVHVFR